MKPTLEEIESIEQVFKRPDQRRRHALLVKVSFHLAHLLLAGIGRFVEILLSLLVLPGCSLPVLLVLFLRKVFNHHTIFRAVQVYGYHACPMTIRFFNISWYPLRNLSLFYYVLIGKMALTGISIKYYIKEKRVTGDAYLFSSKPGIFNLWYVRQSSRIAHSGKFQTEWDYLFRHNLFFDLLLILKSIPALLYFSETKSTSKRTNLFDIPFDNLSMKEAVALVNKLITTKVKKKIFFINPDCLNKSFSNAQYRQGLLDSDYIFPDGIGINLACKLLRTPLKENINGTDMLPFLCELAVAKNYRIYLLGGKPGVAEQMKQKLEERFQGLTIAGVHHGYFDKETESNAVITQINAAAPDIVLVAFGAPYQEQWISQHVTELESHVLMGVGGLFDFYSEKIKRAPQWMREIGLEWIYRLLQEPGRMWRRYIIGNPLFLLRVLKWKLSKFNQ